LFVKYFWSMKRYLNIQTHQHQYHYQKQRYLDLRAKVLVDHQDLLQKFHNLFYQDLWIH
jgi:hypothetical protein